MKCKPYSEITVEIWTQLKTVKITSNIFAVQPSQGRRKVWGLLEVMVHHIPPVDLYLIFEKSSCKN